MKVKLALALLRRRELHEKVDQLKRVKEADLFETKTGRRKAHEGIDDIIAQVPLISLAEVTREYDHYAKQLRLCDASIQQENWTAEIDDAEAFMTDYEPPVMPQRELPPPTMA